VNPETDPAQPAEVDQAIADLLGEEPAAPDPWWQAGIDDSLEQ
jgi:hypothetical protein